MIDKLLLQPVRDISATRLISDLTVLMQRVGIRIKPHPKVYGDVIWCLDNVYLTLSCSFFSAYCQYVTFLNICNMLIWFYLFPARCSCSLYVCHLTPGQCIWLSHSRRFYRAWVILFDTVYCRSESVSFSQIFTIHHPVSSSPPLQKVRWCSQYVTLPLTLRRSFHRTQYVISFDVCAISTWFGVFLVLSVCDLVGSCPISSWLLLLLIKNIHMTSSRSRPSYSTYVNIFTFMILRSDFVSPPQPVKALMPVQNPDSRAIRHVCDSEAFATLSHSCLSYSLWIHLRLAVDLTIWISTSPSCPLLLLQVRQSNMIR